MLKKYMIFIAILTAISIVLGMSYSNFKVTSENHKVAEMYIGTLKYSMTIDGSTTNTLSVPNGETIIDVTITNENPIDTYYKLIYESNSNITITYYEGYELDDSNNVSNSYDSPNDKLLNSGTKTLKLKILNNSTTSQNITFKITGGFATNTLEDVTVPTGYTIIEKDTSTNTYFCTTTDTLTQGLQYVNGQYTYAYEQEVNFDSAEWENINKEGWGVQLTNLESEEAVTSKICTYINNKPLISTSNMFVESTATTIDLNNFNTSNITNMTYMFGYIETLTLDLSNFDTSNVTNMSGMFEESQTTEIKGINAFNTSKVTNMSDMFSGSQTIDLDVSNFDTSKVTNMSYMFASTKATVLDISNFDTSNVTNMCGMFSDTKATTIDVSKFDTSKVTDMRSMFSSSQATTLNVSNFDTSNVTEMGAMFSKTKITTLDLSSFNTSKVTSMGSMFSDTKITTLDLSNFDTSNVTNMSSMFWNSQLTTLDLSNFDTSKVTDMRGMFYNIEVEVLDLSNFNTKNVVIMRCMFMDNKSTTIIFGNFDTSNVTDMDYMFQGSQAVTLDLSSFDTSNVTSMYGMFNNSTKLTTIYASNKFKIDSVTGSTDMFKDSTNLVGGAGTTYNSSYVDKTYARIDGGTSNPGYFTDVADKDIPEPNSFATDSWKTIAKAVRTNNTSKYNVEDTRTIDMGTYGTHTLRIANTSTPSECSTSGFSQSACGFVLEFTDIITTHNMNEINKNMGGWPASIMYTFVNDDIYNSLPNDLKNVIIDTTVVSGHGSASGETNFTSSDKLYLLSPGEVYSDWKTSAYATTSYDTAKSLTRTLDYYTTQGVTTGNYIGAIKKNGTSDSTWWLRTAYSSGMQYFYYVDNRGMWEKFYGGSAVGVSPAFRIG